jgi:hypothetical protein
MLLARQDDFYRDESEVQLLSEPYSQIFGSDMRDWESVAAIDEAKLCERVQVAVQELQLLQTSGISSSSGMV